MSTQNPFPKKSLIGTSSAKVPDDGNSGNSLDRAPFRAMGSGDRQPYKASITDLDPNHHFIALHGDPLEISSGQLVYACRICDSFEDATHFRSHEREKNVSRYNVSLRLLANVSCRKWVSRPDLDAAEDNLIERALDRERQREHAAGQKPTRWWGRPAETKHDADFGDPHGGDLNRGC